MRPSPAHFRNSSSSTHFRTLRSSAAKSPRAQFHAKRGLWVSSGSAARRRRGSTAQYVERAPCAPELFRAESMRRRAPSTSAIRIFELKGRRPSKSACAAQSVHSASRRPPTSRASDGLSSEISPARSARKLSRAAPWKARAICARRSIRSAMRSSGAASFRANSTSRRWQAAFRGGAPVRRGAGDIRGRRQRPPHPARSARRRIVLARFDLVAAGQFLHAFAQRNIDPTNETPTKGVIAEGRNQLPHAARSGRSAESRVRGWETCRRQSPQRGHPQQRLFPQG